LRFIFSEQKVNKCKPQVNTQTQSRCKFSNEEKKEDNNTIFTYIVVYMQGSSVYEVINFIKYLVNANVM
jgi:hypothetical protein